MAVVDALDVDDSGFGVRGDQFAAGVIASVDVLCDDFASIVVGSFGGDGPRLLSWLLLLLLLMLQSIGGQGVQRTDGGRLSRDRRLLTKMLKTKLKEENN